MEAAKSIASLTWSDTPHSLNEVLEKYRVPNLVCIQEGHYGMNEACTFENDQLLMLHALRTKHNVMAEDSVGRPIAVPLECEDKLLVCPLSIYCRYDPIFVSEMSHVYPDIKYFRVLENTRDEGIGYLKPESILEIEYIDATNSAVKFKDVEQPVPFTSRIVFETLLDYREYTLKDAVRAFGLPAKVRFLSSPNANQSLASEFENLVSNLGKITVLHSAKPELVVVATKVDADSVALPKTSVKCSQISKDYRLNVYVAKGLLKNDPVYVKMVRDLNKAFLDKYDLKELDNLDKCQYLDQPDGNTRGIIGSVLVAKVPEQNNNFPELLPRADSGFKAPPPLLPRRTQRRGREITPPSCDRYLQIAESVRQYESCKDNEQQTGTVGQYETCKNTEPQAGQYDECKDTNQRAETLGHYDDRIFRPRGPREKYAYLLPTDYHVYESISDDSSDDDGYEFVDDDLPMTSENHVAMTSQSHANITPQDHVNMMSHDYVDMTSQDYMNTTSEGHVTMTSQEEQYYAMSEYVHSSDCVSPSAPQNKSNRSENSVENTGLKPGGKSSTETKTLEPDTETSDETTRLKDGSKNLQRVAVLPDLSALKLKPVSKNSDETMRRKPDNTNLRKTISLETVSKSSQNVTKHSIKIPLYIPTDVSALKLKSGSKSPAETMITKSDTEMSDKTVKLKASSKNKAKPKVPIPKDQSALRPKAGSRISAETMRTKPDNNKNLDETTRLKASSKSSVKVLIPKDQSPERPKAASRISAETMRIKPENKNSQNVIPKTKTRSATVPISNNQSAIPSPKTPPAVPIPADLSCLSVAGVRRLLTSLNMQCYVNKFREEQIDGEMLMELDETTLRSLDLKPFHVRKLLKVIEGWRPNVGSNA